MGAWLDRLASANRLPLWLDDVDYSARLLAGGTAPWLDATAVVAWRRKAMALLEPDAAVLAISPLCAAWVAQDGSLREEMAAKRRPTAPLRALLAAGDLRSHIGAVLQGLRASSSLPLAFVIPSPRAWVAQAQDLAFGDSTPADEDAADSASVYVADFLRSFGESGVDVLLFEEDAQSAPADPGEVEWYRSAVNVARHYGWDVGLHTTKDPGEDGGLDFIIGPGSARCSEIEARFWTDGMAPAAPACGFRYAAIPVDAEPQTVLDRLRLLR